MDLSETIANVTGFQWGEGNLLKNWEKHRVTAVECEQVFFNQPLLLLEDSRHGGQEPRFHALGKTHEGRTLHITFTLRADNTLIRVISARDMHRKERAIYEQAS